MHKLKIAVVGPGLIGKQHIRLIGENPDTVLSCIVAPDHLVNHHIAKASGVPLYHSIEDCLSHLPLDGVVISSPNQFHAEQAQRCIESGIPVLVEKPVTATVAEGAHLVNLVQKYRAKVLVGHHRAHSPLMDEARSTVKEGRLGRLVSVIGSAQFYKPASYFNDGPWRTQPGGGPILINLIHEIGSLRSLMGEITAVQAIASSKIRNYVVEDTVAINFVFDSGALGTFLLSDTAATAKSWEQTSRENSSYPSYPDEDCYTIAGTRGSLAIPSMRLKCYPNGTDPSWWTPFTEEVLTVTRKNPLECQLAHFVDVIRGKGNPLVSVEDGFRNLLITEAIRTSAMTRTLVEVDS